MKVKKVSLLTIDEVVLKSTLDEFGMKIEGSEVLNKWDLKVCEITEEELIFNGVITSDGLKLISVLEQANQKEYTIEISDKNTYQEVEYCGEPDWFFYFTIYTSVAVSIFLLILVSVRMRYHLDVKAVNGNKSLSDLQKKFKMAEVYQGPKEEDVVCSFLCSAFWFILIPVLIIRGVLILIFKILDRLIKSIVNFI